MKNRKLIIRVSFGEWRRAYNCCSVSTEPNLAPILTFWPLLMLNLNSFGASNNNTTVDPSMNPPTSSPFVTDSYLVLVAKSLSKLTLILPTFVAPTGIMEKKPYFQYPKRATLSFNTKSLFNVLWKYGATLNNSPMKWRLSVTTQLVGECGLIHGSHFRLDLSVEELTQVLEGGDIGLLDLFKVDTKSVTVQLEAWLSQPDRQVNTVDSTPQSGDGVQGQSTVTEDTP
ncbi:hypothetical protein WICPIJ_001763 [Wickerhamomyces pijperi]|uniref:Uncharacterized protein n=1 Tax=Wickerhamomyces pijperi TaxID=599730 RepID=A0A9P8QB00_WICPI|nr:hypothetical protein WICPIJ_001763 [Wickerhamomyces pijperi]